MIPLHTSRFFFPQSSPSVFFLYLAHVFSVFCFFLSPLNAFHFQASRTVFCPFHFILPCPCIPTFVKQLQHFETKSLDLSTSIQVFTVFFYHLQSSVYLGSQKPPRFYLVTRRKKMGRIKAYLNPKKVIYCSSSILGCGGRIHFLFSGFLPFIFT